MYWLKSLRKVMRKPCCPGYLRSCDPEGKQSVDLYFIVPQVVQLYGDTMAQGIPHKRSCWV